MKKKNLCKAIVLITAAAMMVSACGKGGSSAPERGAVSGENAEIAFPLEKTAELSFITSAETGTTPEPNNRVIFQRLEEETNVHINWTCFVSDQFADKKNIALANAKNLPDGLFSADMSDYDLLRYAKQGVIIPVEDLIESHMPNLKKVLDDNPQYKAMITAPDGHIYAFPWIEQLGSGKEAIQTIGGMPFKIGRAHV